MSFRRLKTTLLAGAAVLAMSSGAMALTFGSIPGGAATNDGLTPLGLSTPLNGWYGAQLALYGGPSDITATFLGSEAGNTNTFNFGGDALVGGGTGGTGTWTVDNSAGGGLDRFTVSNVLSGLLGFSFVTSGGGLSVFNGFNPDNTQPAPSPGVNFFVSFVHDQNASSGQGVYLFFDDDGAANDDNHDDMVVRLDITGGKITVVPLPAGGLLLLTALGGLAVARRRRNKAA